MFLLHRAQTTSQTPSFLHGVSQLNLFLEQPLGACCSGFVLRSHGNILILNSRKIAHFHIYLLVILRAVLPSKWWEINVICRNTWCLEVLCRSVFSCLKLPSPHCAKKTAPAIARHDWFHQRFRAYWKDWGSFLWKAILHLLIGFWFICITPGQDSWLSAATRWCVNSKNPRDSRIQIFEKIPLTKKANFTVMLAELPATICSSIFTNSVMPPKDAFRCSLWKV